MHAIDLERALGVAVGAARAAGELLISGQVSGFSVTDKAGLEVVTDLDTQSEALIVERLTDAFPGHAVVAEEGANREGQGEQPPTWHVDPIDGTANFAHGLPWFTVSLGLEHHGQRLVGVVAAPRVGWEWTAVRGRGTRLNGETVGVSQTARLDRALIATGFAYDRQTSARNNVSEFGRVLMRCQGVRRVGVASLDCAMVASGWLDGYWELTLRSWDVSAGALLVEEAGGRVSLVNGEPFHATDGEILATNGCLHEELLELLAAP